MPRYDSKIIDCNIFTDEVGKSVQFDITELVKDWYNNGNKHGVMLKDSDEAGAYVEFLATDTSEAYMALRPMKIIVLKQLQMVRGVYSALVFPAIRL